MCTRRFRVASSTKDDASSARIRTGGKATNVCVNHAVGSSGGDRHDDDSSSLKGYTPWEYPECRFERRKKCAEDAGQKRVRRSGPGI